MEKNLLEILQESFSCRLKIGKKKGLTQRISNRLGTVEAIVNEMENKTEQITQNVQRKRKKEMKNMKEKSQRMN